MQIHCPECIEIFEVDPDTYGGESGWEDFEVKCPECKIWIIYNVEWDPRVCDERKKDGS